MTHQKADRNIGILLAISIVIMMMMFSACSSDSDDEGDPTITQDWYINLTFSIVEPDEYTFFGTGDVTLHIDGKQVTITGLFSIGQLSYDNLIFEGILEGDQFTLTTTHYQVQYEFDDAVGTSVTRRPPHRSVREELPHTAPAAGRTQKRRFGYGCSIRTRGIQVAINRFMRSQVNFFPF